MRYNVKTHRLVVLAVTVFSICLTSANSLAQAAIDTQSIKAESAYLPTGFTLAAYLDCGPQTESEKADGVMLKQTAGESYTFPNVNGPLGTVAVHETQVEFEIRGLKPEAEYMLGFTWWDVDKSKRSQSVRFGTGEPVQWTTVLGPTPAASFYKDESTWARVLLPITPSSVQNGSLRVAFAKDKGPNAVINELCILERPQGDTRKRVLIVTGDDYPGHLWRETAPELALALREDPRLDVSVVEAPAMTGSPLLDYYDAVVVHFKNYAERLPVGAEAGARLEQYVRSGKGLVLTHFACGAFQEWDGFVNIAGRVWNPDMRPHDPFGEFTVNIADGSHPITAGMTDFATTDELYTCLDGAVPIHVLCQAASKVDQKVYPIAFVLDVGSGRVFHCSLGHDANAYKAEGPRSLYRRAVAWAASLPPTQ